MEKSFKLVGAPCGHHGQYTFYKALRLTGEKEKILAIGDFFFVRIWQDSELVSIGELQLLWTDRVSDQTLVSLRLYFLPENTPDGRGLHGEDEVLAINEKIVIRAADLASWVCSGESWRCGRKAVWRGNCAPQQTTLPLHHTNMDFSDVDREKSAIAVDKHAPGVVVFGYGRYCRYRALSTRLQGIEADWLRDALVAALGGYAAPTLNTRVLYCRDTFEYPELEGHEFVCNHLAPKLKGRPRGRRRLVPRSLSHSPSERSSDSDGAPPETHRQVPTARRLTLRNGASKSEDDEERSHSTAEDQVFLETLREFHKDRGERLEITSGLKDMSLRALYVRVRSLGGHARAGAQAAWRRVHADHHAARAVYERYLLKYENHERNKTNGKLKKPKTLDTIDISSPPRLPEKPPRDNETGEINIITSKAAEELNREFLDSLPKEDKQSITVKSVEKLIDKAERNSDIIKLFEENSGVIAELVAKHNLKDSSKVIAEIGSRQLSENSTAFLTELAQKLNLGAADPSLLSAVQKQESSSLSSLSSLTDKYTLNGHTPNGDQKNRPLGRSSLRAVRPLKPTRSTAQPTSNTPPGSALLDSASSSPQPALITNFGIHHPPRAPDTHSDDEIVEVPYKPKTPEIIDLDEYPESPQSIKKKKLDILKERGLEVTAIPPAWPTPPLTTPMLINPLQHQMMSQTQLFQMYNIIPPTFNGAQPPKVIQATSIFGNAGPEKTVYGNPKDPFMPPPHILQGAPVKPQRNIQATLPPKDILDLTCKGQAKPAVEIVRIPSTPSPSKVTSTAQNLSGKNYTLVDGKAVVGSNLEITLVNKNESPKNKQKRSSNGQFMTSKTPTPPKYRPQASPSGVRKPPITVPSYPISRDDVSPTSSTGSRDSQTNLQSNMLQNVFKNQNLAQIMEMQKSVPMTPFMDPMYMSALYSSLTGQIDHRQMALYREYMANFRGYSGLLNPGAVTNTPTTKN